MLGGVEDHIFLLHSKIYIFTFTRVVPQVNLHFKFQATTYWLRKLKKWVTSIFYILFKILGPPLRYYCCVVNSCVAGKRD